MVDGKPKIIKRKAVELKYGPSKFFRIELFAGDDWSLCRDRKGDALEFDTRRKARQHIKNSGGRENPDLWHVVHPTGKVESLSFQNEDE